MKQSILYLYSQTKDLKKNKNCGKKRRRIDNAQENTSINADSSMETLAYANTSQDVQDNNNTMAISINDMNLRNYNSDKNIPELDMKNHCTKNPSFESDVTPLNHPYVSHDMDRKTPRTTKYSKDHITSSDKTTADSLCPGRAIVTRREGSTVRTGVDIDDSDIIGRYYLIHSISFY